MCPKTPDIFHLATFNSSLLSWEGFIIKVVVFLFWNSSFWLAFSSSFKEGAGERTTNGRKLQIEVYKDHSFTLPTTDSPCHFPKARAHTCPRGPPSFPGWGRQRIPQIKVKRFGGSGEGGSGKKKKQETVTRSTAGPTSVVGADSQSAKAESVVALLGKLCVGKACI